jgi:hypothetical protein
MKFIVIAAAIFLASGTQTQAEVLTNQTVVALTSAGLGEDVIVAKIRNSANQFDVSTESLMSLKKSGVASSAIAAMVEAAGKSQAAATPVDTSDSPDPKMPHASGIYLLSDWSTPAKMIRIDATTSNQTKTSDFFGYALSAGLVSAKLKTIVPNASARVKATGGQPKFYFYFDKANAGLSNGGGSPWLGGAVAPVTSPSEFSLVRFDVRKDTRETVVGKFNIAGAKSGVMDKARIPFTYTDVSPGVFQVSLDQVLPAGEYGFIYSSSSGGGGVGLYAGGLTTSRIFDFTIQ